MQSFKNMNEDILQWLVPAYMLVTNSMSAANPIFTFGYQSAPLVMPSGNGYFRQAELFLIPKWIPFVRDIIAVEP